MAPLELVEGSVHLWAEGDGRSNATVIADGDEVVLVDAPMTPVGPAHTPSDLVVHVPEDSVVVAGDVVFSGYLPVMVEAAVDGWLAALDQLEALRPRHVVPGHGPAGDAETIRAMRTYVSELLRQVHGAVAAGLGVEETVAAVDLPPGFADWGRQDRLAPAVTRLHQELSMTDGPIDAVGSNGSIS